MSDTPPDDFEPTMSDDEALMWRIGADPWLDPSGSLLAVLDRPVDLDLLRRKVAAGIPPCLASSSGSSTLPARSRRCAGRSIRTST